MVEIRHPATGELIGATVTVRRGGVSRALIDALDDSVTDQCVLEAAVMTVAWSGMSWGGEFVPFSPKAAIKLYSALPWLVDQILADTDDLLLIRLCEAVTRRVELDTPSEDGTTQREALLRTRQPINDVKPPGGVGLLLWNWFWQLDATRASSGFGLAPISYTEIAAWSDLMAIELRPSEVDILRAMDMARLRASDPQEKEPEMLTPAKFREMVGGGKVSSRPMTPQLFDALFDPQRK